MTRDRVLLVLRCPKMILINYTLDFGGQTTVLTSQNFAYPVEKGPFVLKGEVNAPDMMEQLKRASVDSLNGNTVVSGSLTYPILDGTLVYEYRDNDYYLSNLDRVNNGSFKLTAWYDKTASKGGGVRVLVAVEK